jgi:hypothetical protein
LVQYEVHQQQQQVEHQRNAEMGLNQVDQHEVELLVDQTIPSLEMTNDSENEEARNLMKLPVVRAARLDKGKEIKEISVHEREDGEDSSDSDYEDVHEADSGDSSADDDEAICYRKKALELKNKVKRKMLGEEELKETKVPEEFIVLEITKEDQDDGSDCFDTEDELSYEEDSDGDVRTRKTKHRVYDESAEVQEFEVGQAFHDSRQFKQAVVNYGLKKIQTHNISQG